MSAESFHPRSKDQMVRQRRNQRAVTVKRHTGRLLGQLDFLSFLRRKITLCHRPPRKRTIGVNRNCAAVLNPVQSRADLPIQHQSRGNFRILFNVILYSGPSLFDIPVPD
jgi:hypothetical protein